MTASAAPTDNFSELIAFLVRILLGRIAGIEETRLQQLGETGQVDQIIKALK